MHCMVEPEYTPTKSLDCSRTYNSVGRERWCAILLSPPLPHHVGR